jgi:hypothetical protein
MGKKTFFLFAWIRRSVALVIGWAVVAGYVFFGGEVLRKLELSTEIEKVEEYCVKIDMLMAGMASYQRKR